MRTFVIAALIAVTFPAAALAQAGPLRGACAGDVKSLCGAVQPGGGRIRECMKEHRAELSTACKVAIADRMLERQGRRNGNGGAPGKPDKAAD